jgi:hypothetical protein
VLGAQRADRRERVVDARAQRAGRRLEVVDDRARAGPDVRLRRGEVVANPEAVGLAVDVGGGERVLGREQHEAERPWGARLEALAGAGAERGG